MVVTVTIMMSKCVFHDHKPPLLPYCCYMKTQQAHSLYFGGNLLASGIGMSAMQSGSGLWSRNTTITSTYNPTFTPKVGEEEHEEEEHEENDYLSRFAMQ